ncbi:MAG: copper resistance protein CopC [Rhodoluna sp.]|nr:copper resistance protein CopC [Rhodoluna sp.]
MKRLAVAAVCAFVLMASQVAASAHASLSSANPSVGSILQVAPTEVTLVFDDDIQTIEGTNANLIEVTNERGEHFEDGSTQVQGATVKIALQKITSGTFTVAYRVVSADGHPVSSEYSFEVAPKNVPSVIPNQPAGSESQVPPTPTASASPTKSNETKAGNLGGNKPQPKIANNYWLWPILGITALALLFAAWRRFGKIKNMKANS